MRVAPAAVALLLMLPASPGGAAAPPQALLSEKLDLWLAAAAGHTPGYRDRAIEQVARWPVRDFDDALRELKRRLDRSEYQPLAKFGVSDVASGNTLLLRGAVLHADIAIVYRGERGYGLPQVGVRSVVVGDGSEIGQMGGTIHWAIGRRLLDLTLPDPSRDERVKQWYQATAAYIQQWNEYSELSEHFVRARLLFPNDPLLLMYAGTMHAAFAEGRIQNALPQDLVQIRTRPTPATPQGWTPVGSADAELDRADDFFRRALARDPALTEARIRLAHVLNRRGSQQNAIVELERALRDRPRSVLRYYAYLLLGRAQVARNRPDGARAAFEQAATLYPAAQSPRIALSQLAHDAGDRARSMRELTILTLPDTAERVDPWWSFNWTHTPDADELLALVRQSLTR